MAAFFQMLEFSLLETKFGTTSQQLHYTGHQTTQLAFCKHAPGSALQDARFRVVLLATKDMSLRCFGLVSALRQQVLPNGRCSKTISKLASAQTWGTAFRPLTRLELKTNKRGGQPDTQKSGPTIQKAAGLSSERDLVARRRPEQQLRWQTLLMTARLLSLNTSSASLLVMKITM